MEKFTSKNSLKGMVSKIPAGVKQEIENFADIIDSYGLTESAIYLLDSKEPTPLDRSGTGSRYDINNAEQECTKTIDGYTFHTIIECDDGNGVLIVRSPSLVKTTDPRVNDDERVM